MSSDCLLGISEATVECPNIHTDVPGAMALGETGT
jgi:hypothetical protein